MDKVKPLKYESPDTGGTELDSVPTSMDPAEDYVSAKGVAFEGLDTVYIDKSGSDIRFTDLSKGPWTLKQLREPDEYYEALGISELSTTSTTTYTTRATFTTGSLPSGKYELDWSCTVRTSSANRNTHVRLTNGATVLREVFPFNANLNAQYTVGGKVILSSISGVQTFTLEFRVGNTGGTTSFCKDATLTLRRVS